MGNAKTLTMAVFTGAMLFLSFAHAQTLSEPALFARCYSHLTGGPVPLGNVQMQKIRAGALKAQDACAQILDKAVLDPSGPLVERNDPEARKVLNTFNALHRSWFSASAVEEIQSFNNEISRGTTDVYDSTEPALGVTRAAFMRGAKFDEVLTYPMGVHGLREQTESVRAIYNWIVTFPNRRVYGNHTLLDINDFSFRHLTSNYTGTRDGSIIMNMPKIEVGELIGIRPTTESFIVPNVALEPLGRDLRGNAIPGLQYSYDFYQSLGGGVIGTPIYILLNFGHNMGTVLDGGLKTPRRWAQANMHNLLCASLPALREADIASMVVPSSKLPFRTSASCVMCHATLDQMAGVIRNTIPANSDYALLNDVTFKATMTLPRYHADLGAINGWPAEANANYHRTSPTGKLYFRSMTGELINKSVNNTAEMGAAMAQTKDFYYCAAKRYFQYFTGISVSLYDRMNPANQALNQGLSASDVADRKFVEALGEELQSTQSVREVIKKIMNSDYYRAANFRSQK